MFEKLKAEELFIILILLNNKNKFVNQSIEVLQFSYLRLISQF